MLRSMIFIGISTWTWCYALWSSIAIPHDLDATFYDLQLAFPHDLDATLYDLHWHFHMNLMLRRYALWSSLAFPHDLDATLYDLQLSFLHDLDAALYDLQVQFHMILMLRSMIFNCNSTWSWCYALWSSLAFPHDLDATLYDLHWHFHMNLMLRSMIFNCNSTHPHPIACGGVGRDNNVIGISTWTWCYALWSSLAFPHDLDATLYDLHWHFHMNLMLRSMICNCNFTWCWCLSLWSSIGISTWSWCYALWSSLAFPHEPDATLYDLQLQFHTSASDSLGWGGVGWGGIITSLAFPHDLDATLYDLHWHFHMNLMLHSMIFNARKSCGCPFWGMSVYQRVNHH